MTNPDPRSVAALVWSWIVWAVGIALMLLLVADLLEAFRIRVTAGLLPTMDPYRLALLCGAYWLVRR